MMLTFTDTPVTKIQLVTVLEAHQAADRIVQGHYWENGKGCAVGCSLHDFGGNPSDHSAYERLFGIPGVLAWLEDGIFEGLPIEDARAWPVRFAKAVPEGKSLSLIWPKFAVWLLADPAQGVIRFAKTDRAREVIQDVADAYARVAAGGMAEAEDWKALRTAATTAATTTTTRADARAICAADTAIYITNIIYDATATSAAGAAALATASESMARKAQADKLIELLEGAGVEPGGEGKL